MPEAWKELFDKLPLLRELLCAVALVIVDITALVVLRKAGKEHAVVAKVWDKVGSGMELADETNTYVLGAEEVLIGRHTAVDIRIPDMAVSRYHALLTVSDGVWRITDLQSAGGTYVNGKRIRSHRLNENDRIVIGETTLILRKRRERHV